MSRSAALAATVALAVLSAFPAAADSATLRQQVSVSDTNRDGTADVVVIVRNQTCRTASARLGGRSASITRRDRARRRLTVKVPSIRGKSATLELRCGGRRVLRRKLSLRMSKQALVLAPKATPSLPTTIAEPIAGPPSSTPASTPSSVPASTTPAGTPKDEPARDTGGSPTDPPTDGPGDPGDPGDPTDPPTDPGDPTDPPTDPGDPTDPPTDPGDPTDPPADPMAGWNVLSNPIDPTQQTSIGWCKRSYWQQPWRAYLDTRPAAALADGTGINMNSGVGTPAFARTAAMLGRAGFRTARLEVGWSEMSYADPSKLTDENALRAKLQALKDSGIRPLILLNANHGNPGPTRADWLTITEPVGFGQTTIKLDAASAAKVVPGLTGFGADKRPDVLITSVNSAGVATLSRPSPWIAPPGAQMAYTLRYRPFTAPLATGGGPQPYFEQTLAGWLQYADAVTKVAKSVTGAGGFDVEVWNELNFGSDFLDIGTYYASLPNELRGTGTVTTTILARTTSFLRDSARGLGAIGISDGFASQGPWESAAWEPAGLTTMSKHPYQNFLQLNGGQRDAACQAVDATGRPEGFDVGFGNWRDGFTPQTGVLFPEYPLSAIQTETMIRDLSPITTMIGNVPHGRAVTNPISGEPLGVRVSETGLIASSIGKSAAEVRDMQARWAMRALVAFVAKGASSVELYGARDPEFGFVAEEFFTNPSASDAAAGQSITAIKRMLTAVGTARPTTIQPLTLDAIGDNHNHAQFVGDGSAAHPPLYDRDVVAAFPFQRGARSYAIPAYVMTRDMTVRLAPERFRMTFSGLAAGHVDATAYDPETDTDVPVQIVSRNGGSITLELDLTDSPRVISLTP